ncbi:hypothetical protein, partial [Streptomyces sp. NPDC000405]|uniref:hypothetical protein n=1 Tax=Streptomyces sp. NPDC000405 TaxID=3161033 RepID=UPI00398D5016
HAEALEADLLRHYGVDLLDWHRGTLSSRRLAVLVKHMPRDSAVNRDLHGEAVQWDASTHLLAALVDHAAVANWMTATINSGEDAEPLGYPEPAPRPGSRETDSESDEPSQAPRESSKGMPSGNQLASFFG